MNIRTSRLELRPVREADLMSLVAALSNPRIARNLTRVPWPYGLNDARHFYEQTLRLPPQSSILAITLRANVDQLVGVIAYEGMPVPELGYWLGEAFWNKGITSEAASAVIERAFTVSGNERVRSRCILGNEPSRRVLIGLGSKPVGISSVYSKARKRNVISQTFELTANEWRQGEGSSLWSKVTL
jgi:8-oxo-dGTP diphosphatase